MPKKTTAKPSDCGDVPKTPRLRSRVGSVVQETKLVDSPSRAKRSVTTAPKTPAIQKKPSSLPALSTPASTRADRAQRRQHESDDDEIPVPIKIRIRKSAVARGKAASKLAEEESNVETVQPLKGRETEFARITEWVEVAMKTKKPVSVYLSGAPGTGKTATTSLVVSSFGKRINSAIINCVSIKTQTELIRAILQSQSNDSRPTIANLTEFLEDLKRPLVLVLDEIDHLSTNTNAALYTAFQWPYTISPRLILIGIANSIDLTERLLPKLKLANPPQAMVFAPYTKDNIVQILEDKMQSDEMKMDSKAVELCARKVAAMTGDLRTALHVFKQTKATAAESGTGGGCREVLGVLNSVYSSPLARARLPLQPRILLAVCLTMSTNKKTALTRTSLFSAYAKACTAVKVPPLDSDDLSSAFQTLESQSFVSMANNGQIRLQVDATTARSTISDNIMVEQIATLNF